jgi:hypothetical protein
LLLCQLELSFHDRALIIDLRAFQEDWHSGSWMPAQLHRSTQIVERVCVGETALGFRLSACGEALTGCLHRSPKHWHSVCVLPSRQ